MAAEAAPFEGAAGQLVLGLNEAPSMNAVLRALKKEDGSLWNCLASIADDARFVQQAAARYPGLPLFPNLRCGLWYVPPPVADTCYFKSTDGHNNNWSFSTVRLNLNVALAAASAGGCIIVDATKRGKRFPDAMSKTVPMWAAVLNGAVARLRQRQRQAGQPPPRGGQAAAAAAASAAADAGWDAEVHLPPWVSSVEANSIRQRLEGWVAQLEEVGADLSGLAASLHKPLRCLWVSQEGAAAAWEGSDAAVDVGALPFTPIVLVGASATTARQRRCLTLPPEEPGQEPLCVSFSYFPGAADDEESWACGLTPCLMWGHLRSLLAAGPVRAEAAARQLLERQRVGGQAERQQQQSPVQQPAGTGLHCLLPQGCRPAQAAAVRQVGSGIFQLGEGTRLAISSGAASAAPAVWQHVDAVLHLGLQPLAGMQQEPQPQPQQPHGSGSAASVAAPAAGGRAHAACRFCWLPVRSCKEERHSLQQQLPAALRFARAQLSAGRSLLLCCDSGCDAAVCAAVACLLALYQVEQQPGGGTRITLALGTQGSGDSSSNGDGAGAFPPVAGAGFSKLAVRQHLAAVSACYPAARPTRGSLRQVFNFFLAQLSM